MAESWYFPETRPEALDSLEDITFVIDFIQDSIPRQAEAEYVLSDRGAAGFGLLLSFLQDTIIRSSIVLGKEVHK